MKRPMRAGETQVDAYQLAVRSHGSGGRAASPPAARDGIGAGGADARGDAGTDAGVRSIVAPVSESVGRASSLHTPTDTPRAILRLATPRSLCSDARRHSPCDDLVRARQGN